MAILSPVQPLSSAALQLKTAGSTEALQLKSAGSTEALQLKTAGSTEALQLKSAGSTEALQLKSAGSAEALQLKTAGSAGKKEEQKSPLITRAVLFLLFPISEFHKEYLGVLLLALTKTYVDKVHVNSNSVSSLRI